MKKLIALMLALVMVLSLTACGGNDAVTTEPPTETPTTAETEAPAAGASFTVVVVDLDGTETTFQYTSTAATVGEALLAEGLIEGEDSEYGLYVKVVNGITADYDVDETYWGFYIDGEYALTGVDATAITDGATYSFVRTGPEASDVTTLGEGAKTFAFSVVDLEGSETKYQISTDETTVGAALLALELIEGEMGDYGLYVKTVNGITADYDVDGTYWAFYIDGEYGLTGVDATEITERAAYSFVQTKG